MEVNYRFDMLLVSICVCGIEYVFADLLEVGVLLDVQETESSGRHSAEENLAHQTASCCIQVVQDHFATVILSCMAGCDFLCHRLPLLPARTECHLHRV